MLKPILLLQNHRIDIQAGIVMDTNRGLVALNLPTAAGGGKVSDTVDVLDQTPKSYRERPYGG
jgi:hypothetical protein